VTKKFVRYLEFKMMVMWMRPNTTAKILDFSLPNMFN